MQHSATPQARLGQQPQAVYSAALSYARAERWAPARVLFNRLLKTQSQSGQQAQTSSSTDVEDSRQVQGHKYHSLRARAWVSWAMMEAKSSSSGDKFSRCRDVLQRGLKENPTQACLLQAWGLAELKRDNWFAAVMLLERAVQLDPRLAPVLHWAVVEHARIAVGMRRRSLTIQIVSDAASEVCA
mmetsp:Transcript_4519/g.7653  ORF Transcript_4519/g.7653 Transcript_4519/m.7653 type:complete len:185 (-) Transcript_4519:649-1203(-)|eukprot:CAMPEP_0119106856 /NCGR_PEP_ID=MMETSP1180-20130426/6470_1 /TAXON_ID=3052 ORGANISM="Chlamydomonas cf sp, Strain CCMP681" /NCGR_SAMPLE_ID=MMETSP1180 /ASSEMBLY_ACC=CAM_ASM_000741 /LENGTH=184 /DNA_ID=CAMNT_0007092251 /DNA_START=103 /DNA_END=657 /DNA_ORIENTATION=+